MLALSVPSAAVVPAPHQRIFKSLWPEFRWECTVLYDTAEQVRATHRALGSSLGKCNPTI
jgi:hypothetical protein